MCGIVGIYDYSGSGYHVDRPTFDAMVDSLAHRGPDGRGVWYGEDIALGHRRLAILDPSPAGAQPMTGANGTCVVTYNGEIYNFRELRQELTAAGHSFRTNCDTEVLLASYAEWGVDAVARLNGIFAFVLWDSSRRRLWLVRDRLGVKPLCYTLAGGVLRFASEIKAILADPSFPRRPSPQGLSAFLSFGYVPAPLTGFAEVLQVPPAHFVLVEDGTPALHRYWSLSMQERAIGLREAEEEFSHRLRLAVRRQMVSDVPIGGFLSGGIDSAAVVAEMAALTPQKVRTFCVGFAEESFDESRLAAATAAAIGTDHTHVSSPLDFIDTLDKILAHCEDPFADSSSLAVFHLCRVAAGGVTVALSGDGADELLAGYSTYSATWLAQRYRKLPWQLRALVRRWILSWPASDQRYSVQQFASRFALGTEEGEGRDFASWRIHFRQSDKSAVCKHGFFPAHDDLIDQYAQAYWHAPGAGSPLKRMLYADLSFYLPNDMLVKVDRMSMANSLEVRVPFLDHELVEFCVTLPDRYLVVLPFVASNKRILRRLLRAKLGPEIARRRKTGFNVPIEKALRRELFPCLADAVRSAPFCHDGPFDVPRLMVLAERHQRREVDAGHLLFTALVLARWWNTWFSPAQCRPSTSVGTTGPARNAAGAVSCN